MNCSRPHSSGQHRSDFRNFGTCKFGPKRFLSSRESFGVGFVNIPSLGNAIPHVVMLVPKEKMIKIAAPRIVAFVADKFFLVQFLLSYQHVN